MGGTVRTNAAAAILGVSPSTLRSWERRFGFPRPRRTAGGHRMYEVSELEALRQAFSETASVSSAVALVRSRGEGPATPTRLRDAFCRFDEVRADRLLEESLAVRSVERTAEEVLVPCARELCEDPASPAEAAFAWRFATGWLAAMLRVAPPSQREEGVLLLEATRPLDPDALHAQALELCLRRAGLRTLCLPASTDPSRVARALRAVRADALVLCGREVALDDLGRTVYAARRAVAGLEVLDAGGVLPGSGGSTVPRLPALPTQAREVLLDRFSARERGLGDELRTLVGG